MARHLLTAAKTTLTALKGFGVTLSISCTITAGFPNITFRCILKKWNTDLITEKETCLNCFYISILVTFPTNYLVLIHQIPQSETYSSNPNDRGGCIILLFF